MVTGPIQSRYTREVTTHINRDSFGHGTVSVTRYMGDNCSYKWGPTQSRDSLGPNIYGKSHQYKSGLTQPRDSFSPNIYGETYPCKSGLTQSRDSFSPNIYGKSHQYKSGLTRSRDSFGHSATGLIQSRYTWENQPIQIGTHSDTGLIQSQGIWGNLLIQIGTHPVTGLTRSQQPRDSIGPNIYEKLHSYKWGLNQPRDSISHGTHPVPTYMNKVYPIHGDRPSHGTDSATRYTVTNIKYHTTTETPIKYIELLGL